MKITAVTFCCLTVLLAAVACNSNPDVVQEKESCPYSKFRRIADESVQAGAWSAAAKSEAQALDSLHHLDDSLWLKARLESLQRHADFAAAAGMTKKSIDVRESLVDELGKHAVYRHELSKQRKITEVVRTATTMDARRVKVLSKAFQNQIFAEAALRNENPTVAIQHLEEAIEHFDDSLGANNLLSLLNSVRLIEKRVWHAGYRNLLQELDAVGERLAEVLGPDHLEVARLDMIRGEYHTNFSERQLSLPPYTAYRDAILANEMPEKMLVLANAKLRLAYGLSLANKQNQALALYEEVEQMYDSHLPELCIERVQLAYEKSLIFQSLGQMSEGEYSLNPALEMLDQLELEYSGKWNEPGVNGLKRWRATVLARRAYFVMYNRNVDRDYRYETATRNLRNANRIFREIGFENSYRNLFLLRDLAKLEAYFIQNLSENADYTRAIEIVDRAIKINEILCGEKYGKHYPQLLNAYLGIEYRTGNFQNVIAIEQELDSISKNAIFNERQFALCVRWLAYAQSQVGYVDAALESSEKAVAYYSSQMLSELSRVDYSTAQKKFRSLNDMVCDLVSIADLNDQTHRATAFNHVAKLKGMVARLVSLRSKLVKSLEPELRNSILDATRKMSGLSVKAKLRKLSPQEEKSLNRIRKEFRDVVDEIGNIVPETSLQFDYDALSSLEKLLPQDCALVDIFMRRNNLGPKLEGSYIAFVYNKNNSQTLKLVELGDSVAIGKRISDMELSIAGANSGNFISSAADVRKVSWDKIKDCIGNCKTVIICGDGKFNRVPWHGLPLGEKGSGRFLVQEYQIVPAFNVRDVIQTLEAKGGLTSKKRCLLAGDFDFGIADQSAEGSVKYPQLQFSRDELAVVKASLPQHDFVEMVGKHVRSEDVLRELGKASHAHFATHGTFFESSHAEKYPYAFCGLALSDANLTNSEQNHFLSGQEIISSNLSNLNLVVLSACETGAGKSHLSEGLAGMQHAFLLAGAKSCIASRWPISDAKALKFMRILYKQMIPKNGQSLSLIEAMANAQIQMIEQGEPLECWANWKLMGDWR